ncbi:uncharacterized protein CCOS01_12413 [Colletotrichum costaricense]|uniref:Arca-like protein n=1 Tax=Colletotrichum costaricense TaxID=1209916 RepID=A0AAI9YMI1_9PEZI|nr:uncharacterized protein CCOS01_12413 [Colletotrichum costaricense]KAK1516864.1 hypothetical protein CCOS01_12413 [Colletotrichum costaricense]
MAAISLCRRTPRSQPETENGSIYRVAPDSDKGAPCGQCVRKGRACVRGTKLKFRHITVPSDTDGNRGEPQYEFSDTQKWCRVAGKRIRFIDETADINSLHNDGFDSDDEDFISIEDYPPSPPALPPRRTKKRQDEFIKPSSTNRPSRNSDAAANETGQSPLPIEKGQPYPLTKLPALHPHPAFRSPSSGHLESDDAPRSFSPVPRSAISEIGSGSHCDDPSLPEPRRSFSSANFPLEDRREADLVRHFREFIAASFDYGDPHNRISVLLLQHAALSPVLLNAVLAVSAKSKDEGDSLNFFDKPAERYYEMTMELLQPALDDAVPEVDEAHIAAAVLLRLYENIYITPLCQKTPVTPIWRFLSTHIKTPEHGTLLEAAMWAWIRIEIFRSVMRNEKLDLEIEHVDFDRSLRPADDDIWAWRMCLHTVDVLNYCYGENKSRETYDQLVSYAAKWMRSVPESFMPVLNEIFTDVKILAGMADSISPCNPAHISACMAIVLAGDRFTIREEQDVLYELLSNTADDFSWDVSLILAHLKKSWNWPEDMSI